MAMKFYTEEEALDKVIGTKESAERIEYDARMDEFLIGEAIRQARKARNLTQEDGNNVTFQTVSKLFRAMNIKAMLDLNGVGRVALF